MVQYSTKEKIYETLTELQKRGDPCPVWELMNPVYGELCRSLGTDAAIGVYLLFSGQQLSFPCSFYKTDYIRECVLREFDGNNLRQLSKKYNRSEKIIRRFLQEGRAAKPK